jgi:hypothetical protein
VVLETLDGRSYVTLLTPELGSASLCHISHFALNTNISRLDETSAFKTRKLIIQAMNTVVQTDVRISAYSLKYRGK